MTHPARNTKLQHPLHEEFFGHLKEIVTHVVENKNDPKVAHFFQFPEHEFVSYQFHDHIKTLLHTLKDKNPEIAQHLAQHISKKCERVFNNHEHEHIRLKHKEARVLHAAVQEIHAEIMRTLKTQKHTQGRRSLELEELGLPSEASHEDYVAFKDLAHAEIETMRTKALEGKEPKNLPLPQEKNRPSATLFPFPRFTHQE